MKLRISDALALPLSIVTSTLAILGKKRGGKSYKASVLAEEMLDAEQQIIVVDPTSAWWGLRSSADGLHDGYPISIFGGEHGDLPLDPAGGAELADAIVSERFSAIIDTSDLTKGQEQRFLADFLERLYRKNKKPVHLFLDEADIVAPQRPFGDDARVLGAAQSIVRRGGIKGIGVTMITQRPAELNKGVLSQIDQLVLLKLVSPPDLDAVEDWVKRHDEKKMAGEMLASLPSLPKGDVWIWAPADDIFKRVAMRDRRTFDSGKTPEVGKKVAPPKKLAQVDIERLGEKMRAAVERQKESDPKALRAKIAELVKERDQLSRAVNTMPAVPGKTKIVEKPVLRTGELDRFEKQIGRVGELAAGVTARIEKTIEDVRGTFGGAIARLEQSMADLKKAIRPALDFDAGSTIVPPRGPIPMAAARPKPRVDVRVPAVNSTDGGLSKMERTLLTAVVQHPGGLTRKQALIFAGYRSSGDTSTAFARLVEIGYLSADIPGRLDMTSQGEIALGDYERLPTGDALRARLLNGAGKLSQMERTILNNACEAYPNVIKRGDVIAPYKSSGDTSTVIAKFITMGYLTKMPGGVRAAEELFG